MKQEVKDRWTTALRSGQYEQGQGQLKKDGKFCCLGVLCDVVGFDLDQPRPDVTSGFARRLWGSASGLGITPPVLSDLLPFNLRNQLANLNDAGRTFPEIADRIEQFVEVTE